MKVSPYFLVEIYGNLEHGDIQGIANQLGILRSKVLRELTTFKKNGEYDEEIINSAIARIEARGIKLKNKSV